MERLEEIAPVKEERLLAFHQSKTLALHNKFPIMADELTLQMGNKVLLNEVSFQLPLGKKIAIIGENGSGKSTLGHHIWNNGEGVSLSHKDKIGDIQQ